VKKVTMLFMVFLVIISLFACSKEQEPKDEVASEDGYLGKYIEEVNVKSIKYIDPTASSNMAKLTSITGETLDDNRWLRGYKDDLNINIEYTLTGSGEAFLTQWSGLMATGDIPDVFPVGFSDYQELVENGFLHDLTDAFDKYASPLLKEILNEAGPEALEAGMIDGKIYGIPQVVSKYDSYKYLWIRRDWMANVGVYEAPKTIYELIELMYKFVNMDPNNTGVKDTYAFNLSNDLWHNLQGYFAAFGAYPSGWIVDPISNKIKLGAIDDAMIEPLTLLQDMYIKGWINPEFITLDYTRSKADVANGRVGIYMGAHFNAGDFLLPSKNRDENADWAVFPWPGKTETDVVKHQLSLGVNDLLVVNKTFGNPEIAVKMLNYYYEKLYGETGNYDFWGNDQVDLIWAMGPLFSYRPTVNLIPYLEIQAFLRGEKLFVDMVGVSRNYYKNIIVDNRYDWQIMFGTLPANSEVSGGQTAGYFLDQVVRGDIPTFQNQFYGPPTPSMGIVGSQLGMMSLEYFTKAIRNERNTTTEFAAFREFWLNQGGRQITEEINQRFER
jgi:putative aldouronate transport system substrate-binding protein